MSRVQREHSDTRPLPSLSFFLFFARHQRPCASRFAHQHKHKHRADAALLRSGLEMEKDTIGGEEARAVTPQLHLFFSFCCLPLAFQLC